MFAHQVECVVLQSVWILLGHPPACQMVVHERPIRLPPQDSWRSARQIRRGSHHPPSACGTIGLTLLLEGPSAWRGRRRALTVRRMAASYWLSATDMVSPPSE